MSSRTDKIEKRETRKPTSHEFITQTIKDREVMFCGIQCSSNVYFGYSILNPVDEANKDMGETIAYNRALCSNIYMYISFSYHFKGYNKLNKYLLRDLIKEYARYFRVNIDNYMKFKQ